MSARQDMDRLGAQRAETVRQMEQITANPTGRWVDRHGRDWRELSSAQRKRLDALGERAEQIDAALDALQRVLVAE